MEMLEGLFVIVEKCSQPISRSEMACEAAGDCYTTAADPLAKKQSRKAHSVFCKHLQGSQQSAGDCLLPELVI